ncbi:hypothetical protein GXW83_21200 [Streptacidiphilus sp. PB12-B1b]|uniref:hypothetical protein n=1 Tax=Streptacidiphilus sp. PB12-B1b TaxID=2705012 RepID=UPI0015FBED82|nr:hypothetical protein [Streptacidiphilus sp. PB12-B1b]QMU77833.1 hypothetical protein GXW83_21200 [Streptacidiphilus sp. PB12-B1b]
MSRAPGRYGKLGPQFPVALRDFTAYQAVPLPTPPAAVDWATGVSDWPMDGNDEYGDCTMAAAAHMIQSWNAQTGEQDPVPADRQVVSEYLKLTGGKDTGLVESDVLKTWQRTGLWGNKVVAYAPVNVHALTAIQQTIALFGGVYAGIQVPANAQQQFQDGQPWTLVTGWQQQPIEGGHAVPLLGYDADWLYAITWGAVQQVSWDWWSTYADEAWAVLPEQYRQAGTVNGIDLGALTADLKQV